MSWWDDWWGSITSDFQSGKKAGEAAGDKINKATGLPDAAGAVSALSDSLSFTKAIWLNVSDYRMWRSLGWLLLGIVLMILGFVVWNRKAVGAAAAKIGLAGL
jgi:hypothetical protein